MITANVLKVTSCCYICPWLWMPHIDSIISDILGGHRYESEYLWDYPDHRKCWIASCRTTFTKHLCIVPQTAGSLVFASILRCHSKSQDTQTV